MRRFSSPFNRRLIDRGYGPAGMNGPSAPAEASTALGGSTASRRPGARLLGLAAVALTFLLAGYALGRLVTASGEPDPAQLARPTSAGWSMPATDANGVDLPRLPRYPGSVRVDYQRQVTGTLLVTEVEYLTAEPIEKVHRFYRSEFRARGWKVANVEFVNGEWKFLLLRDTIEATAELEPRGGVVEIDLDLFAPTKPRVPAAASPGASGQGGAAGGGDGDDDDGEG
jgi:hypothetical protein